ncbi:zf-CCHC domain-containing protein [Cephalotus follicularis]|uniref:Zf-CCHC domain-containing protein n=1 Tax=Cephalotus follicularis TaxID=3775 RepID=A0A1Q3DJT4_CEPFO|nr:zf-CCHC domain-containing protein [Cephalotus follicularis]
MNEYHIINKLQEMTMVSNAHKIRNNSDKAVANILISGFTGQIKGWWDNILITQQQNEILESVQVNESKEPNLDTNNETIEDAVSTLPIPKIDRKNYYKKQFEKPEYYRKPNKRKTHFKTNKFQKSNNDFPKTNSAICYNCGKPGHIAKYCYIRKQIKKLDLIEDHRNLIFKIIDNQNPEEGESDYFSTSSTTIQAIKNSSSESEFSSNNSKIKTCNCINCIIGTTCNTIKN